VFAWAVLLPIVLFCAMPASAQLLDPTTLTKYIDPLPQPPVRTPSGLIGTTPVYDVHVRQVNQKLHSELDSTPVFTFDGATPGPTFLVNSGAPVYVRYWNDLPLHHVLPVDTMISAMRGMGWGDKPRFVSHLHGGDVPAAFDGWPYATIDPGQMTTYWYPNSQKAATLWYHDHSMGITRLNAYAGIAGFYIVVDPYERGLGMPAGPYEIGIALQDRQFYADGRLYYPATWEPEHFGDVALVNGVIWPKLEVEPRKYRVHLLAGGNDRFWNVKLLACDSLGNVPVDSIGGPAFYQVGTEQGLMPTTAVFNDPLNPLSPRLLMGPGKRFDVIIDFAGKNGQYFLMHNNARTPFKGVGNPAPDEVPLPELFLVHVKDTVVTDLSVIPMAAGKFKPMNPLKADFTRDVVMEEVMDSLGNPTMIMLNGKMFNDPVTELPELNSEEIWRWINTTEDVHPMHMHLVQFQVIDRQPFDMDTWMLQRKIVFTGPAVPPELGEVGWMDTQNAPPGFVTRTMQRFSRLGNYVYHCHILAHEENEMMRPFTVVKRRPGVQGSPIELKADFFLDRCFPDPFEGHTSISYGVPNEQRARLSIYNALGQEIRTLVDGPVKGGAHQVLWDATDDAGNRVAAGTYFYKLSLASGVHTQKTTLLR
jgi:spore coat protein A